VDHREYGIVQWGPDGQPAGIAPGPPGPVSDQDRSALPRAVHVTDMVIDCPDGDPGCRDHAVRCPRCGAARGLVFLMLEGDQAVRAWCPDGHGWLTSLDIRAWQHMKDVTFGPD
jgi:hypothetical protein